MPHAGAQYMLIDDRPPDDPQSGLLGLPGTYPVGSCMPDPVLQDHNHLATELWEWLQLRTGRPFEGLDECRDKKDWSELVWDLIRVGLTKAFNRKRSGRLSDPRISGGPVPLADGLCFARSRSPQGSVAASDVLGADRSVDLFRQDEGPPERDDRIADGYEGGEQSGTSLVLIETQELE